MIYEGENILLRQREQEGEHRILELIFKRKDGEINVFDQQTLEEFAAVTEMLEAMGLDLLLVKSASDGFIAGADVKQFSALFAEGEEALLKNLEQCNAAFTRFSDLPFPTLAAIKGFAMGGGLELALCCDFRLLNQSGKIGLPEVKLGIIPGFGGTVRMPRLVGVDNAVEWVCTGADFKAGKALADGVVDAVVADEQFEAAVEIYLQRIIKGEFDYQARRQQKNAPLMLDDIEKQMAFTTTRGLVASQASPHMPAPLTAHKAMLKHSGLKADEAIKVESKLFAGLASGSVSRALIGLYLGEKNLAKNYKTANTAESQLAVIGAGIMGGGIAYQAADRGFKVVMKDIQQQALDLGISEAVKLWDKRLSRGRLATTDFANRLSNIKTALEDDAVSGSSILVEAVVENLNVKQSVLAGMEKQLSNDAVMCSNTSTIEITKLAANLQRPENFCGMHFFNPVHRMPLVEIIRGEKTSFETISRAVNFAVAIGKTPVVVNDCAGFYVNRVLFPYLAAFNQLIEEGVDYRVIDAIMEREGWPMGPAYLLDVVGIDTAVHAASVMAEAFPERMSANFESAIEKLFAENRFGQKNQLGFYQYSVDPKGKPLKSLSETTDSLIYSSDERVQLDESVIRNRLLLPMFYEVVRCLDENIVEDFPSADLGLVMGIGFPLHLGGPLRFLDEWIVNDPGVFEQMQSMESIHPLYQIPDSLKQRFINKQAFYQAGGQHD